MRVIHVSANGDRAGGAQLIKTLVTHARDVDHAIATRAGSHLWNWADARGLPVIPVRLGRRLPSVGTILHLHGSGAIALAFLNRRTPTVLTVHGLHHVHNREPGRAKAYDWLYRRFAKQGWPMVFVSNDDRETAIANGLATDGVVIPNPADLPPGLPAPTRMSERGRTVAWVGRFVDFKRPELCIEIAARLPSAEFFMVGAGDLFDACRTRAPANVRFLGELEREGVLDLLGRSAIALSTSAWEGLPYSMVEAVLRGACPAGFDVLGVREVLAMGGGHVLTEDPAAAAVQLDELLLELENGRHDDVMRAGQDEVGSHFAIEQNIARYLDIYARALNS